jgi:acetyltransferase-like isoleucine patch superfamily enzyme
MLSRFTKKLDSLLFKVICRVMSTRTQEFRALLHCPYIHGPADRLHLGRNVNAVNTLFNTNSGSIFVGDYTFFGHNCMVITGTHNPDALYEARREFPKEGNDIHLGRGIWLGSGAIILGGVSIPDHCVIAAGAVVTKTIVRCGVYGGVPAIFLRDIASADSAPKG